MLDESAFELEELTVKELVLKLYQEFRAANGLYRKHVERTEADLYGDPLHQIIGIKATLRDHESYIDRARTVTRVLLGLVGVVGIGNIVALIRVFSGG